MPFHIVWYLAHIQVTGSHRHRHKRDSHKKGFCVKDSHESSRGRHADMALAYDVLRVRALGLHLN